MNRECAGVETMGRGCDHGDSGKRTGYGKIRADAGNRVLYGAAPGYSLGYPPNVFIPRWNLFGK